VRTLLPVFLGAIALGQDFSTVQIERVSSNHVFTEGPAWSRDGYLVFSDVPPNLIYRLDSKGKTKLRENSNGANGNAFDAQGRLLTCESRTRRVVRLEKNGDIAVLAEKYDGKRFNAPNDIAVRRDGHIFFTDPAFGNQEEGREMDYFGVYHLNPKGELKLIAKPKGRPNGIAFSPNGRILYVANSDERNLRAYDVGRQGEISNERILISNIDGVPDGMTVDEKGNLYVTAKSVFIYSPDGKPLGEITMPERPTNVTFGDGDLLGLYITAQTGVYRARMPVKGHALFSAP
jgi:gluconolactonase